MENTVKKSSFETLWITGFLFIVITVLTVSKSALCGQKYWDPCSFIDCLIVSFFQKPRELNEVILLLLEYLFKKLWELFG